MKKMSNKSFFYGICFFSILALLFLTFYLTGFELPHKKHSQKEPRQQTESLEENGDRLETTKCEPGEIEYYLGIYVDQIAVYEKRPQEDAILREVLPLKVKEVYYPELQKGVPFSTEEEKNLLLENYTS